MDDTPIEVAVAIQNVLCRIERRLTELTDATIITGLLHVEDHGRVLEDLEQLRDMLNRQLG